MVAAVEYRQRAAEQHRHADTSRRPLLRLMHKKAAQRRETYARDLEGGSLQWNGVVGLERAFCV